MPALTSGPVFRLPSRRPSLSPRPAAGDPDIWWHVRAHRRADPPARCAAHRTMGVHSNRTRLDTHGMAVRRLVRSGARRAWLARDHSSEVGSRHPARHGSLSPALCQLLRATCRTCLHPCQITLSPFISERPQLISLCFVVWLVAQSEPPAGGTGLLGGRADHIRVGQPAWDVGARTTGVGPCRRCRRRGPSDRLARHLHESHCGCAWVSGNLGTDSSRPTTDLLGSHRASGRYGRL